MKELTREGWKATEVHLLRDLLANPEPFRRHFHTRLRFEAEQAVIVFPAADLTRQLAGADPPAYSQALHALSDMEASSDTSPLRNQVLRLLNRLIIPGKQSSH